MLREEGVVSIRGKAQTRFYRLEDPIVSGVIYALCDLCNQGGE